MIHKHLNSLTVFAVLMMSCVGRAAPPADDPTVAHPPVPGATARVYQIVDGMPLQVHVLTPDGHAATDARPAIVLFNGGGWRREDPRMLAPQARHFAGRGMVAIIAEYRVEKRHGTTPFDAVEDARSAMRWVRAHAAELGIDPGRIVAAGGSAGGHLAAATAFLDAFDGPADNLAVSPEPDALILFNPAIDTTRGGYGWQRLGDRAEAMSPLHHVGTDAPPTLVFHGTEDRVVPFRGARAFADRMQEHGNLCELVPYDGRSHGFFHRGKPDYDDVLARADAFLVSLGFLRPRGE